MLDRSLFVCMAPFSQSGPGRLARPRLAQDLEAVADELVARGVAAPGGGADVGPLGTALKEGSEFLRLIHGIICPVVVC